MIVLNYIKSSLVECFCCFNTVNGHQTGHVVAVITGVCNQTFEGLGIDRSEHGSMPSKREPRERDYQ